MKKKTKIALGGIIALFGVIVLSSCTKSFCSNTDTARAMYIYEPGITQYLSGGEESAQGKTIIDGHDITYTVDNIKYVVANFDDEKHQFYYGDTDNRDFTGLSLLNNIISAANNAGIISVGSNQKDYFVEMDKLVFQSMLDAAAARHKENITLNLSDVNSEDWKIFSDDMSFVSYVKFVASDSDGMYNNWDANNKKIRKTLDHDKCIESDFISLYKSTLNSQVGQYRTCQTTVTGKYNTYTYHEGVYVSAKDWSYAWSKGFFEGLLVYPIGWLVDQIAVGFSGIGAGYAALLSIFFVTLIIRGLMMIATIKQTNGNAKMTALQPEITKIQNKYPNANTNKYEKQRMAEEMNALYKKNKINPLSTLLVLIIQFPVFICVWGALSGSAILTNGEVFGHLSLGMTIKDALFNATNWTAAGGYVAVSALFLFLIMSAVQAVSMLLPQWIQKSKAKKVAKLGKNPSQKSQDNKMKWVTYIMLVLIIIMGFSLVSAMGVYWLVGAIISIGQTLITQVIQDKKAKKRS